MGERKPILISMLGGCSLSYEGAVLDGKNVRSKRIWKLIEYLISYRFRCVTQDELIDLLYREDRSASPAGALKTLVHRAREALSRLGYADGKDMIIKCAEGYRWNPALPLDIDTKRFEELLRRADLCAGDGDKSLELRMEALELYKGDFLPDAASDIWAMSISTYFHFQYMTAAGAVLDELVSRERFGEAVLIAGKAISIDPYVESLYESLILALVNTGRVQAAKEKYESMAKLFCGEIGIQPSRKMQALYKMLAKSENGEERDIDAVKAELCGSGTEEGAFFCEYGLFRDIFRREIASAKDESQAVYICLINAEGKAGRPLSPRSRDTAMRRLEKSIGQNLRPCDVFSRCSDTQFVVLLPAKKNGYGEGALERVVRGFRRDNPHSPAAVSFSLRTIEPGCGGGT